MASLAHRYLPKLAESDDISESHLALGVKGALGATTEYSDLDDPALRRRKCGSCRRMCKVVSRVARASRQVLTQHENELSTCSDLRAYLSLCWCATDVSIPVLVSRTLTL